MYTQISVASFIYLYFHNGQQVDQTKVDANLSSVRSEFRDWVIGFRVRVRV